MISTSVAVSRLFFFDIIMQDDVKEVFSCEDFYRFEGGLIRKLCLMWAKCIDKKKGPHGANTDLFKKLCIYILTKNIFWFIIINIAEVMI